MMWWAEHVVTDAGVVVEGDCQGDEDLVAAFDARTESGDLWMPSKMVPGKKFSVHGEPVKSVERGQANSMVPAWITEKFESEALTLSPKNQATVWEASEKAIGETWAI